MITNGHIDVLKTVFHGPVHNLFNSPSVMSLNLGWLTQKSYLRLSTKHTRILHLLTSPGPLLPAADNRFLDQGVGSTELGIET